MPLMCNDQAGVIWSMCVYTFTRVCTLDQCVYMYVYVCVWYVYVTCVYVHICVCMHVHVCVSFLTLCFSF